MTLSWRCPDCGIVFEKNTKQKLAVSKWKHQNRADKLGPPARLPDGKPNPEYFARWYEANKVEWKAHVKEYYGQHKEEKIFSVHRYHTIHKSEAAAWAKRYLKDPTVRKRHNQASVRTQARRKGNPILIYLNEPFEGAHLHHSEQHIGVYIPKSLHQSISHNLRTGKGMIEINQAISNWLVGPQEIPQDIFLSRN